MFGKARLIALGAGHRGGRSFLPSMLPVLASVLALVDASRFRTLARRSRHSPRAAAPRHDNNDEVRAA